MHSIRNQFVAFVSVLLIILLILLNIFPLTASRDQVFEEKKASLSAQASVISSSLGGLDSLSRETVGDVLAFLDISGFARTVVVNDEGISVYDDGGQTGVDPGIGDLKDSLTGKVIFHSFFEDFFVLVDCIRILFADIKEYSFLRERRTVPFITFRAAFPF